MENRYPGPIGLYDPANEHDACGVGFVASIEGRASHQIVQWAVKCVCNVTHRGAVSADAKTGDGAGILTQIPHGLFAASLKKWGAAGLKQGEYGVGMLFLPRERNPRKHAEGIVEGSVRARRLEIIGWREVPVDPSVLGAQAQESLPCVKQVFIRKPQDMAPAEFERQLFIARHRIEKAWLRDKLKNAYIPSFSSRTINYKGLFVAPQLNTFYHDLQDPAFESAIAVFHQRYSTNTFPNWFLAQPFRFLAHNGEINTLQGNRNWMSAREPELSSELWGDELRELIPIIQPDGSDSMSLDNAFELLQMSGLDPLHAMMMLVPDAWQGMRGMDEKVLAFYRYHAMLCEPWDGPAALAFTDGTIVGAALDRNGLRPARYWVTDEGVVIMASEVGVVDVDPKRIIEKGRLGPGQIFGVDIEQKRLMHNDEVKSRYACQAPYEEWVEQSTLPIKDLMDDAPSEDSAAGEDLLRLQVAMGMSEEELSLVIKPMVETAKEPVWSMGNDTPLSVLSQKPTPLFTFFKQLFAQVTNPPIDPIREELVMSLNTLIGERPNMLGRGPAARRMLMLKSPVLMAKEMEAIRDSKDPDIKSALVPILFEVSRGPAGLRAAVEHVCEQALHAVEKGSSVIILSDKGVDERHAPIPTLLAVGAVHHHLIRNHRRMKASIVVEGGDVHAVHHVACLIGFGASAIYPYLAVRTIRSLCEAGKLEGTFDQALAHYRKALDQGLLKVMSKMGISTVGSYRGAQIFEALGIGEEVIAMCFPGTASRLGGVGFEQIGESMLEWHRSAFHSDGHLARDPGGFYRYLRGGEYHDYNPEMIRFLQQSVKSGDFELYKKFAQSVNARPPVAVRDLLDYKPIGPAVPIEEVESVESITRRFVSASISYGALSLEAHETLAIAMNRIGGKSGSGEGGEDPARYRSIDDPENNRCSKIKQVASGRFGVTPEYLMSATELEIKMAQGAKPGEGGQLPGHKVSVDIARVRHTIPGVTLISPPPHHDIYSIEDLSQLIYDLKMINPEARIIVKLVAERGVGTVAAGVAKAYADTILISGHEGGTGASPLSSIKHAGVPWELGLAETQQTLRLNSLRKRVVLRTDGGLKTGRDIILAALFGAEEFGFGTGLLVATGCVMTRKCHLNTCPVGVATQKEELRQRYKGTADMVVNYLRFIARDAREQLAALGARSIEEIIGRSDLLTPKKKVEGGNAALVNLDMVLTSVDIGSRMHTFDRNDRDEVPLDEQIIRDAAPALEGRGKVKLSYAVRNTNRTLGARLAGRIARKYTDTGLEEGAVEIAFNGVAGQSFGAFCINGMRLILTGEANDYVGKGMHGGELIIRPPQESTFAWHENSIIGNVCLYGATGGALYAAGRAGERFGVRNSGAIAVIEGVGDHGCEYMTGGTVVVLGETGRNFGAGMTGGQAFVLDLKNGFESRVNLELVQLERLDDPGAVETVRTLLERHFVATKSPLALEVMSNWDEFQSKFWRVVPRETGVRLEKAVSAKEG